MAFYSSSIDVEAPREAVWDHLHDFATTEQWDPAVVRARKSTRGSVRIGTRYQVKVRGFGFPVSLDYHVVLFAPRHTVSLEASNRFVHLVDTIRMHDLPTGTRVEYEVELTPRGPLGITDGIWQASLDRIGSEGEAGLRHWLVDFARALPDGALGAAA